MVTGGTIRPGVELAVGQMGGLWGISGWSSRSWLDRRRRQDPSPYAPSCTHRVILK